MNARDMSATPFSLICGIRRQGGTAAVEFAIVAVIFFTMLLGIIEFGRALYVFNTLQEATRNLARNAVVALISNSGTTAFVQANALYGGSVLPGAPEVTAAAVTVDYLNANGNALNAPFPDDQASECASGGTKCVAYVRVSVSATYQPMITGLFPFLAVQFPQSTVTMPTESMGAA